MTKEVSAALGTERQFAKQPELPYALRLDPLNASKGISQRVDYDAQRLSNALGVLPKAIGNVKAAIEKRQQENAKTLVNAEKILSGKTKEDLQLFDRMSALQHVDGHNLSHNKYAMAILEQNIGKMASTYAKQQWADMPESQRPKSVEESVGLYQQLLQDNYKTFGENIRNREAFDQGYYNGAIQDTMKVANEADQRINDEAHYKMMMSSNVDMQDLIYSGVGGGDFIDQATPIVKQLELASRDIKEFSKALQGNLAIIADKDIDGSRLALMENMTAFGGTPLKDLISFAPYKKQIAQNCRNEIGRQAYEKYKLPNGGFNWKAYQEDKKNRPLGMFDNTIPDVNIPISEGDNPNLENLSPAMKGVVSKLGGILFNKGFGDVMQLTSGWRSVEHNAEVGGVEGSRHTTGDALDVYIGDPSQEQIDDLKQTLAPYFGYVTVHDAGTGTHLHVQDYQGGIEGAEDKQDMSYGAYDPGRDDAIDKYVLAKQKSDRAKYKQERQEYKNGVVSNAFKSDNLEDAYKVVNESSLDKMEKDKLLKSIDKAYKTREDATSGKLKGEALKIANYENPMNGTNVFSDMEEANIYQQRLKVHQDTENGGVDYKGKTEFTPEEQKHYNDVARRLCWYWSKTNQTTKDKQPKSNDWSDYKSDDYYTPPTEQPKESPSSQPQQNTFTTELKAGVQRLKELNYSDVQINAYLEKYAKKNNMDVEQLKLLLKEG